jgi:pimeloyl-ACP methyl ester carboxylesterase
MAHALRTIVTQQADIRLTESDGSGLPIVMLHGSSASRRALDPIVRGPLADRFRVIAIDLPGHGESSNARDPASGYTIPGFADCVAEVLSALRIDRFAIYGWSLGGHVGIELLHRHPGVAGLMLTGAPPLPRGPIGMIRAFHASWDVFLASKETYSPRDVERYAQLCYGTTATIELKNDIRRADGRFRAVMTRSLMRGDGADQKRTVEESRVPVAIVNGEHDPFIRHSFISGLNIPHLWDQHAHLIYDAGHCAFRDNPERFTALLLRFATDAENWRLVLPEMARSA